uniref:XPG N-terminal domain-containing protein n=1 Tax=viral metagenome TaxID=1070528 RepID=A0A6C0BMN2_9ZZZZ
MGIKSLSDIYTEGCSGTLRLKKLWRNRIAIDAGTWICSSWAISCKQYISAKDLDLFAECGYNSVTLVSDSATPSSLGIKYYPSNAFTGIQNEWVNQFRRFISMLLKEGITPVWVFDGEAPMEKMGCKEERKKARDKAKAKLDQYIVTLARMGPLLRSQHLADLKKETLNASVLPGPDHNFLKTIIKASGLPCLQCTQEAERLCSALFLEGWVSAVYSTDTDALVHGTFTLLNGMQGSDLFKYVYLPRILASHQLTYPQFVDICIMAGCDYNKNMPRIGIKKSLKLIKDYGTIDRLPMNYDITCLNHTRCRELFSRVNAQSLTLDPINNQTMNWDLNAVAHMSRNVFDSYSIHGLLEMLLHYFEGFPHPERLTQFFNPTMMTMDDIEVQG